MADSKFDRYTPYTTICNLLKDGEKLQKHVKLYKSTLGKDGELIDSNLAERLTALENAKNSIREEMDAIWNGLFDIETADDVENMLEKIKQILQKGIPETEQEDYVEIQENLTVLMLDINRIKETTSSRKEFEVISEAIKEKYADSELDFDVQTIIEAIISDIALQLDNKEQEWISKYLTLGDKSRESVHRWKAHIEYIPEYLSVDTQAKIKALDKEANDIIKVGKIDDVILYFNRLSKEEQIECFDKIKHILGID